MIISHSHRFIFIKTKKTAGTSVEVFLAQHLDDGDVITPVTAEEATRDHRPRNNRSHFNPFPEMLALAGAPREWRAIDGGGSLRSVGQAVKAKRFYNHISAFRVQSRVPAMVWSEYLTIAIERNPWDKTLSQYHWMARRRPGYSFADFVEQGDLGVNYPRYCHPGTGEVMVDEILYFEQLNVELGRFCESVGIPFPGELTVRAKSATRGDRASYQDMFTGELAPFREEVDRVFATEIRLHGWDFDSGLPRRLREAG